MNAVLMMALLVSVSGCIKASAHTNEPQAAEPIVQHEPTRVRPIPVVAEELTAMYHANEIAADQTWHGHRVRVQGFVKQIMKSAWGTPVVVLKGSGFMNNVHCRFPKDSPALSALAQLGKGDLISLDGDIQGETLGSVMLDNCEGVSLATLQAETPEFLNRRVSGRN